MSSSRAPQRGSRESFIDAVILVYRIPRLLAMSVALAIFANAAFPAEALSFEAAAMQPLRASELRGAGSWKTDRIAQRPSQRWDLDLKRDGNRVSGTIDLTDSPLADRGFVEGYVSGARIDGRISDQIGRLVARFRGTIEDGAMSGTYRDRTGESGTWTWDGPLPE